MDCLISCVTHVGTMTDCDNCSVLKTEPAIPFDGMYFLSAPTKGSKLIWRCTQCVMDAYRADDDSEDCCSTGRCGSVEDED